MAQQRGFKRAQKVLKRKQRQARQEHRSNIKAAQYARVKALNPCEKGECDNPEHKH